MSVTYKIFSVGANNLPNNYNRQESLLENGTQMLNAATRHISNWDTTVNTKLLRTLVFNINFGSVNFAMIILNKNDSMIRKFKTFH